MKTSKVLATSSFASLVAASGANAYYSDASFTFNDASSSPHSWYVDNSSVLLATFEHATMNGTTKYLELRYNRDASHDGIGSFAGNNNSSLQALNYSASISGKNFSNHHIFYVERNMNGQGAQLMSAAGFTSGAESYIGFKFTYNSGTYYGWAKITLTTGGDYGSATISEWSVSNSSSFKVGDIDNTNYFGAPVPEPADAALGLGALALGAAGLRRWRKNKAARAA